jgi:hypothetical protein
MRVLDDDISLAALLADEPGLRTDADVLAEALEAELEAVRAVVERRGAGRGRR